MHVVLWWNLAQCQQTVNGRPRVWYWEYRDGWCLYLQGAPRLVRDTDE